MKHYCGYCIYYNYRSYKVCLRHLNVSGKSAWYRMWSKVWCDLNKYKEKKNNKCQYFEPLERFKIYFDGSLDDADKLLEYMRKKRR